jgi:hypothetical protein
MIASGQEIASSYKGEDKLPEELAEATSHYNNGACASVSYIQKYNVKGGVPPKSKKCSGKKSKAVPFSADFCLWTQNALPASVPKDLYAPGRLLEGFYGKGSITYKHSGGYGHRKPGLACSFDFLCRYWRKWH